MNTIIKNLLNNLCGQANQFIPKRHFYDSTKINQKRWGKIYRGDEKPKITEIEAINRYFKGIYKLRGQLNVFDQEEPVSDNQTKLL